MTATARGADASKPGQVRKEAAIRRSGGVLGVRGRHRADVPLRGGRREYDSVDVYKTQSSDTSREAEEVLFGLLRRMDGTEKVGRMCAWMQAVRSIAMAQIREDHPGATEREVRLRLASRTFDRATMIKVWGWDPDLAGP